MPEEIDKAVDHACRTDFAAIQHLWRQRFGRKLESHREIVEWLCAEHGMSYSQSRNFTMAAVADLLRPPAGPNMDELSAKDRLILAVIPTDEFLTGPKILDKLGGPTGIIESYENLRTHLVPSAPLRAKGFVEVGPSNRGYRRKV